MKGALAAWLDQASLETGILAMGVRLPDGDSLNRTRVAEVSGGHFEQMWQPMADLVRAFVVRRINAQRFSCTFDRYLLQLHVRPDNVMLCLLLTREVAELKPGSLSSILEAFHRIDPARAA